MDPDLSADLLTVDGLESVIVSVRGGGTHPVPLALHSTPNRTERMASDGKYLRAEAAWHLPADRLPAEDVIPGSTITDEDGVVWVILSGERQRLTRKYRFVCSNLSIALPDSFTVQGKTLVKTATGAVAWDWTTAGGAPNTGRIQVLGGDSEERPDRKEAIPDQAKIIVNSSFVFTGQHRILDLNGRYWSIEGSQHVDELDFLQELTVRRLLGET